MTNSFDAGQVILCKIHLHKMIYKNISFLTCNIQKSGVDMKKVTIQDVARALGLSRNTVARALNNSDTVAYETRCMASRSNSQGQPHINTYKFIHTCTHICTNTHLHIHTCTHAYMCTHSAKN